MFFICYERHNLFIRLTINYYDLCTRIFLLSIFIYIVFKLNFGSKKIKLFNDYIFFKFALVYICYKILHFIHKRLQ